MEIKAIVLLTGAPAEESSRAAGNFAANPLPLLDVLGRPAIHHLLRHLKRQNATDVAVISESPLPPLTSSARGEQNAVNWTVARGQQLWRAAENAFIELAQGGAEEILVLRMGAYVELDLDSLLQAHIDNRTHATQAFARDGAPMDLFMVSASRRNEAAYLFRHHLRETRTRCGSWRFRGYHNALETAQHVRCLAVDGLLRENSIEPDGREVRPGVWFARDARVHAQARILAPAFVGERARIRANAVLTRCSVVEQRAEVDCGSVIEDATVLPYTYVGPGLDIMHSVVGSSHIVNLEHDIEVAIADPRLLRELPASTGRRALSGAASAVALLPALLRNLIGSRRRSAELPQAVSTPSAVDTPPGFPAGPSAMEASSLQRTWQ